MKTVLHVIDTTGPGGAERVFLDLFDEFDHGRFRSISLVTSGGWVEGALKERGARPYVCDAGGSFNVRYLRRMVGIVRSEGVDLIQAHLASGSVYASLAGIVTGTPVVSVFHGTVDLAEDDRLQWAKVAVLNRGSSRVVAVSDALRRNLLARTSLHGDRLQVVYNGVDTERFNVRRKDLLRPQLGLGQHAFVVFSLGNLRASKGYTHLVEAAGLVSRKAPHIHFVVAGHGRPPMSGQLDELRGRLGVESTVHFIGFRPDPSDLLASCDLFLLPSTSEGFSISTIEAMACGLPVVATRCGGPEEIITSGKDGFLIPKASSESIARAVLALAGDTDLRNRLGEEARATVAARFSLNSMLKAYRAIYGTLLAGG